jgi:hypothetical protein
VSVDQPFFGDANEEKMSLNFPVDILLKDTGFHIPIANLLCSLGLPPLLVREDSLLL